MNRENLEKWIQKARGSWWEDGLTEILSGISLVLLGVFGILMHRISGRTSDLLEFAWVVILVGFLVGSKYLVQWIKQRWIWHRAGYAHPGNQKISIRTILGLLLIVAAFIILVLAEPPYLTDLFPGFLIFVVLFFVYRYTGIRRFLAYSIIAVLGGIVLVFIRLPFSDEVMYLLVVVGTALLLGGIWQFHRFMRILQEWETQTHES